VYVYRAGSEAGTYRVPLRIEALRQRECARGVGERVVEISAFREAEREKLTQRLGANPADPNEMRGVELILNMNQAERVEYFERTAAEMRLGTPQ